MSTLSLLSDGSVTELPKIFLGPEQYLCYGAFLVALWLLRRSILWTRREPRMEGSLLGLHPGKVLRRGEVRPYVLSLKDDAHPFAGTTASKALANGLVVFENGGSVQEVLSSVRQDFESLGGFLDSSLGFVRYLIWAIPALGFVGTVRGMGLALGAANLDLKDASTQPSASSGTTETAMQNMLHEVTGRLGTAFYTTLVALLLSLILMWVFHYVQETQEKTVLGVEDSCREELIRALKV